MKANSSEENQRFANFTNSGDKRQNSYQDQDDSNSQ